MYVSSNASPPSQLPSVPFTDLSQNFSLNIDEFAATFSSLLVREGEYIRLKTRDELDGTEGTFTMKMEWVDEEGSQPAETEETDAVCGSGDKSGAVDEGGTDDVGGGNPVFKDPNETPESEEGQETGSETKEGPSSRENEEVVKEEDVRRTTSATAHR
ncbi:hypothetical protein KEM55_002100 [Ascosphaera atra]|nr:hypothetical protein KEM55_002100 [Ascosphaera atra]